MPGPPFCRVHLFERWEAAVPLLRKELADADVVVLGSYFPDGTKAASEILDSHVAVKAFYDIDTPITVSKLCAGDEEYIRRDQVRGFDLYFSFTGGPMLRELEEQFGAQRAVPLYCSFDPDRYRLSDREIRFQCDLNTHFPVPADERYACDLAFVGNRMPDREARVEKFFFTAAEQAPEYRFLLGGEGWGGKPMPDNVRWIGHVGTASHNVINGSARMVLNINRESMAQVGFSPPTRVFEAAGAAACLITDAWLGVETFFEPGKEILIASGAEDVVRHLRGITPHRATAIGSAMRVRALQDHTYRLRAQQVDDIVRPRQARSNAEFAESLVYSADEAVG